MKKAFKIIACLLVVGCIAWIAAPNTSQRSTTSDPEIASAPLLRFAWRFETAPTSDDGMPRTQIFLDATYTNNKTLSKEIGIVSGSCNEVDPSATDTDMVQGSSKIQCYAAGLGYWFKIVQQDDAYVVFQKMFEEASLDYTPPSYSYERVTTLPLLY
jgi:hypothetical protein